MTSLNSGTGPESFRKYNNYQRRKFYGLVRTSRPVLDWLEVEVGLEFGYAGITDWSGESLEHAGEDLVAAPTRLSEDKAELIGDEGGWVNYLHLALSWMSGISNLTPKLDTSRNTI